MMQIKKDISLIFLGAFTLNGSILFADGGSKVGREDIIDHLTQAVGDSDALASRDIVLWLFRILRRWI